MRVIFGKGEFFSVGGSPSLLGNKAFMAETPDRLAIKNGTSEKKIQKCENEKEKRERKRKKRGGLILCQSPQFSLEKPTWNERMNQ